MPLIILVQMMVMSVMWSAVGMEQKNCAADSDCVSNQFCNTLSLTCADYILCSSYNRKESSKPSHAESECGNCLEGYSRELVKKSSPAAYICSTDHKQLRDVVALAVIFAVVVILRFIIIQCVASFCCKPFGVASLGNNLDLEMVEAGISTASVPPTPSYIPEINKRKHEDVDTNLVPRIEGQILPPIYTRRPGQTRAFQPPYYVKIDPTYDPDTGPTYPPTDISNKK